MKIGKQVNLVKVVVPVKYMKTLKIHKHVKSHVDTFNEIHIELHELS